MIKTNRLLVLFVAVMGIALAASAPSVSETLVRIQADPAAGVAQASFEKSIVVDGVSYRQPWTQYSWSLGGNEPVPITLADGSTATTTRARLFAAVVAVANEVKAASETPAPPPQPPAEPGN